MKVHSLLAIFAGFATLGGVLGEAVPAGAWSVRQNGSFCMTDAGSLIAHGGAGVSNLSTTAVGRLTCPVIDTSDTPKTGITALGVSVDDNSTVASVTAQACIQLAAAPGGQCGASVATSVAGTGMSSLSPPRTKWTGANDLPYVLVILPAKNGAASASLLYGYTFSG